MKMCTRVEFLVSETPILVLDSQSHQKKTTHSGSRMCLMMNLNQF